MSFKTGIHRLAQVLRAMGILAAAPFVFLTIVEFKSGEGLLFLVAAALAYGFFWAIAWIADGFAKE